MYSRVAYFGVGVLATALLVGCGGYSGPPLAVTKGKVTMDGSPVAGATVTMFAEDMAVTASGVTELSTDR